VQYTTSCNTQSSAPEDGRYCRPKHVELIGIINKLLLLHLVGYLSYLYERYLLSRPFFSDSPGVFVWISSSRQSDEG
jgi:hypothetical protein